jgi:type IV pilus assembly protein PilB
VKLRNAEEKLPGKLRNVSLGGLLLETECFYPFGLPVRVEINFRDEHKEPHQMEVVGDIVRIIQREDRRYNLGLQFLGVTPDIARGVDRFLSTLKDAKTEGEDVGYGPSNVVASPEAFGQHLVKLGLIDAQRLAEASRRGEAMGMGAAEILAREGALSEEDHAFALASFMRVPFVQLEHYLISPELQRFVPEKFAFDQKVLPLFLVNRILTVAMPLPIDLEVKDRLARMTGFDLYPVAASPREIARAQEEYYGVTGEMQDVMAEVLREIGDVKEEVSTRVEDLVQGSPVVKFLNLIIKQAVEQRSSDIHVEPERDHVRIRYRIDGELREINKITKELYLLLVTRAKVLSDLDISETRVPQDGRFRFSMGRKEVDLRVSTFPTVYGENLIMRVLDMSIAFLDMETLGIEGEQKGMLQRLIARPHGIVMVTGPTGSGKTTTLYSILRTLDSRARNVITIEDPVEYPMEFIRQTQINPKAGLTFATAMRSVLRQDPDIIMVGEIRDQETAKMAVEAALTGHLVFSTLHTNDAPGAIIRLCEIGVESFLVASAVEGVIAQRLVRTLCERCKESYSPPPELLEGLGWKGEISASFARPVGCAHCRDKGYRGRIGIFEMMEATSEVRELAIRRASTGEIKKLLVVQGMETLMRNGLRKAAQGKTSVEEVIRVTQAS